MTQTTLREEAIYHVGNAGKPPPDKPGRYDIPTWTVVLGAAAVGTAVGLAVGGPYGAVVGALVGAFVGTIAVGGVEKFTVVIKASGEIHVEIVWKKKK